MFIGALAPSFGAVLPRDSIDRRVAWIAVAYAVTTFAFYCFWKASLAERSADTAIFENLFWNAAHGHGLQSAIEGGAPHLALHFSPILYLLVPLYVMWPSLHFVHVLVCAGTAAAGYLLYREVRRSLTPTVALLAMAAFLLHPTIVLQTFMEFHEQALAPLPLMALLVAARHARWRTAAAWALVLLSIREDNLFTVAALAAVSGLVWKDRRTAFGLAAVALAWAAVWHAVGIQALGGGRLPSNFGLIYGIWGDTPAAAAAAIASEPLRVLQHIASPPILLYLSLLFAPTLGVLPMRTAWFWIAVPSIALIVLADTSVRLSQIRMHYSITPAVVLAFAAGVGLTRMRLWRFARPDRPAIPVVLAGAMLLASLVTVPVWALRAMDRLNPDAAEIRATVLSAIPRHASVSAPGYLLNELAARREIGLVWNVDHIVRNEWVILEEPSRRFFDGISIELAYSDSVGHALRSAGFEAVLEQRGLHVWRRVSPYPDLAGTPE